MNDDTRIYKMLPPRRSTHEVRIGSVTVGGNNPVAVQSMTNFSTLDTEGCVRQIEAVRAAGGRIVRLTAQGPKEAENLRCIAEGIRRKGLDDVALVADIHFRPEVALIAARYVDKVRINPGNYRDAQGTEFRRLIDLCRERGVAIRVGVNHGSLSQRIVEKWGDTPEGMVESAMEFLRVCLRERFDQVVVSMKSSNVLVMVAAYRLLVLRMKEEGMSFPLHLGVTEAGDGMQGRVKSAVGIGTLLADGIGDTIRVSLTEPPENEIPVGLLLARYFDRTGMDPKYISSGRPGKQNALHPRRETAAVGNIGGGRDPLLFGELDRDAAEGLGNGKIAMLDFPPEMDMPSGYLWERQIEDMEGDRPVVISRVYDETDPEALFVKAASDFGMPLLDGLADGVRLENRSPVEGPAGSGCRVSTDELALAIMQAARVRISHTEYIACPGCGRTLYDLQGTLARIRSRTDHLKGLKIGVMGCIVNGPGEMADADYGYVGEGAGKVSLYKGRRLMRRAVPQQSAVDALVDLIKQEGDWREP